MKPFNAIKTILFTLLLLQSSATYAKLAGQALIDSFAKALDHAQEDTNKVKILERLSYYYSAIDMLQGIKYGEQSLALATKLDWQKGIAAAYNDLGSNYDNRSDYPRALENYLKALKINEAIGNKDGISANLGNIGTVYDGQRNHDKALEYYFRALQIVKEIGDIDGEAINMSNIGTTYMRKGYYDSALKYQFQSLSIKQKLDKKEGIIINLGNISDVYFLQKKFSLGMRYALQALDIAEILKDKRYIAGYGGNIGLAYLAIALDTSRENRSDSLVKVGRQANLANAIHYLKKGIAASQEIGLLEASVMFWKSLAEIYELQHDYKNAADAYKHFIGVNDSVNSSDSKIKIANLETQREAELKEKQVAINQLERNKKRDEQVFFILGMVALVGVILIVVRSYRQQKAANDQKAGLLKQKDMLMKEIHHRVKNNLQVIGTLLDLQLDTIADTGAKSAMAESTARVRSISLIHQQLYQEDEVSAIEFSRFTADLMNQVTRVFKAPHQDIELVNDIPVLMLDIDTAVPLGLILNELLSNSFKYAFNNAPEGSIIVAIERENGIYKMLYRDTGPGLPDDMAADTKSLGMKMIRSLSKQLGGKFTYDKGNKTFVITFKDESGRKEVD